MPPAVSSQMTIKRISREIADVAKEDLGSITLKPAAGDNLFVWKGSIPGPQGSPYEGGVFEVDVILGTDYPFSAPKVTFSTRIYHMNISERGNICIDILKNNWSPALSLFKVMLSLSSLLTDPNPSDPLVPAIATEFVRNRAQHDKTARRWTELYAKPPPVQTSSSEPSTSGGAATNSARNKSNGKSKATPVSAIASSSVSVRPIDSSTSTPKAISRPSSTAPPPPPPTSTQEMITIPDSDDEVEVQVSLPSSKGKGKKRKREATVLGGGEAGEAGEVVDLTDEENGTTGRQQNKRRTNGNVTSLGSRRKMGDVIVIDD